MCFLRVFSGEDLVCYCREAWYCIGKVLDGTGTLKQNGILPGPTQASACLAKPDPGQCFIRAMCGVVSVMPTGTEGSPAGGSACGRWLLGGSAHPRAAATRTAPMAVPDPSPRAGRAAVCGLALAGTSLALSPVQTHSETCMCVTWTCG